MSASVNIELRGMATKQDIDSFSMLLQVVGMSDQGSVSNGVGDVIQASMWLRDVDLSTIGGERPANQMVLYEDEQIALLALLGEMESNGAQTAVLDGLLNRLQVRNG